MTTTLYNVSAALGLASAYVNGVLSIVLAILCLVLGVASLRKGDGGVEDGEIVQATVTKVSATCESETPTMSPCDVTVTFALRGKDYSATFRASRLQTYAVGAKVDVRVAVSDPTKVTEAIPWNMLGWLELACAVLLVAAAIAFIRFARDSKNFAAATGALTFFQSLFGLL